MRARKSTRLTLLDVVTIVSRIARNEREAAAVINHMLSSARISFANPAPRDLQRMMLA